MDTEHLYSSPAWRDVRDRAISRDGEQCTVSRLLGGPCSAGPLHAHHIVAVRDGGAPYDIDNVGTTCSSHHPFWESLRRQLVKRLMAPVPRCTHRHPTREARRICEQRMARARQHEQLFLVA